jgi:hypothetical protein
LKSRGDGLPSFARELEQTLHNALAEANSRWHEYATLEHLLLALIDDPYASRVMDACGVNRDELRETVRHYLDNELVSLSVQALIDKQDRNEEEEARLASFNKGPDPTSGFQRVVQRSILHVQSSGREEVTGGNVLVALFSERESYAVYFLQQQDMSRLDAVTYISHGVGRGKAASVDEPAGKEEPPSPPKRKTRQRKRRETKAGTAGGPGRTTEPLPAAASAPIRKIFRDDLKAVFDSVATEPVLNTPRIADKIVEFVLDLVEQSALSKAGRSHTRRPLLTIGLFGPWGSGKSTLLSSIGSRMVDEGFVTVFINTWKWDGGEDIFAFMNRELLKSLSKSKGMRWRSSLVRLLLYARTNAKRLTIWIVALAAIAIAYYSVDWYGTLSSEAVAKGSLLALAAGAVLSAIAKPVGGLLERLILQDSEGIESRQSLSHSYRYLALIRRMTYRTKHAPIAFLFDDLDRCDDKKVVDFIRSIHSLTADGSVCVLACDEEFAAAAIYSQFRTVADYLEEGRAFGARFLEKIIQLPFRLPEVSREDLESLGLMRTTAAPKALDGDSSPEASPLRGTLDTGPAQNVVKDLRPAGLEDTVSEAKLSEICGATLALVVEPCRLQIRQAKMLSNIVKLYSMIFPPIDEASAERLAAFLIVSYVDQDWIPRKYFALAPSSTGLSSLDSIEAELRRRLGDDVSALDRFYRLFGMRRPKPQPVADPASVRLPTDGAIGQGGADQQLLQAG